MKPSPWLRAWSWTDAMTGALLGFAGGCVVGVGCALLWVLT